MGVGTRVARAADEVEEEVQKYRTREKDVGVPRVSRLNGGAAFGDSVIGTSSGEQGLVRWLT